MEQTQKVDYDTILKSVGGWGKFQFLILVPLCCVAIFAAFSLSFVFVARDTKYRCKINSCSQDHGTYNPEWLQHAVPYTNNIPSRCLFYQPNSNNTCTDFNQSITRTCHDYVFEYDQITIVQDFDITCDENLWKLTLAGTVRSIGGIVCLPFAGLVSDRFGRKRVVFITTILSSIIGVARSFSPWYSMYVILEFLGPALCTGIISGALLTALEYVDIKRRSTANSLISVSFASGQIFLGLAAWKLNSWRTLLLVIYAPGFLISVCLYFVPESIRWLISKNRTKEAQKILNTMSKLNKGTDLDAKILAQFEQLESPSEIKSVPILTLLKSKALVIRIVHCAFTWLCCCFPYNGIIINAVGLSEDIYFDFIYTAAIGVVAFTLVQFVLNYLGRRKTLGCTLILGGIACAIAAIVPEDKWLILGLFLTGKFFISLAYATISVYTLEMFPTGARHFIGGLCGTFGSFGVLIAAQVPIMERVFKSLPLIAFAISAVTSGVLAFWFPETLNSELPDKIDEAENIENRKP